MNVLDFDRRFIDENAHRESQAAQRHQVDGLPTEPIRLDNRRSNREWNVEHHHEHCAQSRMTSTIRPVSNALAYPLR